VIVSTGAAAIAARIARSLSQRSPGAKRRAV
jgi:hypothetical protein